jgi:hypothetical protein
MESSVTRLLVATKMLLEALTKWSLGQRTENQVSDIYVRLGNDFNVANVAFGSYGIDMNDLASVPDDLRDCLERCLSEDASPQTLEVHLPRIREIIIGLLQGLKSKQAEYKQLLIQRRSSARNSTLLRRQDTASSSNSNTPGDVSPVAAARPPPPPPPAAGSVPGRRPMFAPPLDDASAPQRPSSSSYNQRTSRREPVDDSPQVGDLSLPEVSANNGVSPPDLSRSQTMGAIGESAAAAADPSDPSVKALKSREALERRASKRFSAYTFNKMGVGLNQGLGMSSYGLHGSSSAMSSPAVDRGMKRSLARSSSERQSLDTPTKNGRGIASETIPEAADPPLRRKASRPSPRHSPKPSLSNLVPPPMSRDLNSSTESLPFVDAQSPTKGTPDLSPTDEDETAKTPTPIPDIPPVPPLPSKERQAKLDAAAPKSRIFKSIALFLQLGRQTKKVTIELDTSAPFNGLSTGKLRMLFMDRFSYSPGKDDFPAIYVKDVNSGVTYEMEDLTEIGDGTVLTLNIEPLDQVKQHLDLTLGGITRELREIKTAMQDRDRMWTRRLSSVHAHDTLAPPLSPQSRISDAQFAMAGARVAQFKRAASISSVRENVEGPADVSDVGDDALASTNVQLAGDQLRKQYEEVLKVRRQIAIMMQVQDDFKTDVGGLLGGLREQAKRVRAIAATELPTERNFIITGKARLDSNSQEVLTLVEDLLDSVDDLKADVIQRGVKPKPHTMKKLGGDIERATRLLDEVSKYVDLVKPSWKKTWEMELQNIVDEQEFLNHQEGLIADLKEDHANLQDVYHNIQEVVKIRGANRLLANSNASENALSNVSLRTYIPPPLEEGHEGLPTVMMEVKTQSVNHEKRLKALEAAEKQRLRELRQRRELEDTFQNELSTFVDGKTLKKTGGYQETERVRGRRDKLTLQAMFGGGGVGGAPQSLGTAGDGTTSGSVNSEHQSSSSADQSVEQ